MPNGFHQPPKGTDNAHKKSGLSKPPEDEEIRERDEKRRRFECWLRGHRAFHNGEPRPRAPKSYHADEAAEFRRGFYDTKVQEMKVAAFREALAKL